VETDQKARVRYRIDESSFRLKRETEPPTKLEGSLSVSVTVPANSALSRAGNPTEFTLNIDENKNPGFWIVHGPHRMNISAEKSIDCRGFVNSNLAQLVGLVLGTLVSRGEEDFLWVGPKSAENVWILGLVWDDRNREWEGMLAEGSRQPDLARDFWILDTEEDKEHRRSFARQLYSSLTDRSGLRLPAGFPFCSDKTISNDSGTRQLTVKVDPSELWFLLFPIDHFCRFRYARFSLYREVEWIMTRQKTFIQNTLERSSIREELRDVRNFLNHSVIVLNTYSHFYQEPTIRESVEEGTNLVTEILSLLQDVTVEDEVASLRWYLNPTRNEIIQELLDRDTRYFFANFHAEKGEWQTGDGKRGCWSEDPMIQREGDRDFLKKGSLSHIRLMRVFHCHSVIDPYATGIHPSIGVSLLHAGARRVEGSIMEENYLDYLCSLLHVMSQPQGLNIVLMGKCLERSKDFTQTMRRVGDFMRSRHWDVVT